LQSNSIVFTVNSCNCVAFPALRILCSAESCEPVLLFFYGSLHLLLSRLFRPVHGEMAEIMISRGNGPNYTLPTFSKPILRDPRSVLWKDSWWLKHRILVKALRFLGELFAQVGCAAIGHTTASAGPGSLGVLDDICLAWWNTSISRRGLCIDTINCGHVVTFLLESVAELSVFHQLVLNTLSNFWARGHAETLMCYNF